MIFTQLILNRKKGGKGKWTTKWVFKREGRKWGG